MPYKACNAHEQGLMMISDSCRARNLLSYVDLREFPFTVQVYCHCHDCRKWHQTTPLPAVIFPEASVTVVEGADKIASFSLRKKELLRSYCKVK